MDLAVTFEAVRPMLVRLTDNAFKKGGGEWEDLYGQACLLFMEACGTWREDKGSKLSSWVYFHVWTGLVDYQQSRRRWLTVNQLLNDDGELDMPDFRRSFSEWLCNLTEDAQQVARITLSGPPPIMREARERGGSRRTFQCVIRDYLLGNGWSRESVASAYQELASELS